MLENIYITLQVLSFIVFIAAGTLTVMQYNLSPIFWVLAIVLFSILGFQSYNIEVVYNDTVNEYHNPALGWTNILFAVVGILLFFYDIFGHLGDKIFSKHY